MLRHAQDPQVRWLRRRLARGVVGLTLGWATIGGGIAATAQALLLGPTAIVPLWIAAAAVGTPLLALGLAATTHRWGPVGQRKLRRGPRRYGLSDGRPAPDVAAVLGAHGFRHVVTLAPSGRVRPELDLYQNREATITAVWRRRSSTVAYYSRLSDDRIVVTDPTLPVPHERLVVNATADPSVASLLLVHHHALDGLGFRRCRAMADDGYVFIEAVAVEHQAVRELGSLLAPFLGRTGRTSVVQCKVGVDLDELAIQVPDHPSSVVALLSA